MGRVGANVGDPRDPVANAETITRVQAVVDSQIEFGDPLSPLDPTSTVLAGGPVIGSFQKHNGSLQNIAGSWVEVSITGEGGATTYNHNLNVPISLGTRNLEEPNVRWLFANFSHDGNGIDGPSTLSLNYQEVDPITVNSIDLRLHVGGARVVDGTHPCKVSVFFIPVVRWLPLI